MGLTKMVTNIGIQIIFKPTSYNLLITQNTVEAPILYGTTPPLAYICLYYGADTRELNQIQTYQIS